MQGKNNGERKNRVKKTEDNSCSLLSHFWSTSRSPFSTCYIPFQSSGSQQSNASNGAAKQFWDWGELFGIHGKAMERSETWRAEALKSFAINKSMQGVYPDRLSGQHIRIGCYHFIRTTFHSGRICTQLPPFTPKCAPPFCTRIRAAILHPTAAHFPPGCSHPEFWRRMGEEAFQLLRTDVSGSSDSRLPGWESSHSAQCCCVLLKVPDIFHRYFGIFWDILL